VVSYTTISPLPAIIPQAELRQAVYFLWHFPSTPIWQRLSSFNNWNSRSLESGLSSPAETGATGYQQNCRRKFINYLG